MYLQFLICGQGLSQEPQHEDVQKVGYQYKNTYYPMFGFGHARVKSSVCVCVRARGPEAWCFANDAWCDGAVLRWCLGPTPSLHLIMQFTMHATSYFWQEMSQNQH